MTPARRMGPALAALLVAGNMIGSGLYLLPASLADVGSSSLLAWIIAAGGALAIAGVFAILGRLRPDADGVLDYPRLALHPATGPVAWAAYWVSGWAGNVAIANTAARFNANIPQQDFENKMQLANAKAQPTYAVAGAHAAKAKDTQQMWNTAGNAAGQAASQGYQQYKAANQAPAPGAQSQEMTGQPTRQVIGHRLDGTPIYSEDMR